VLAQSQHDIVEEFVRRARDFDPGVTLVHPVLPDLDLADLEIAALGQDLIEDFRQDQ
jgi:hypothetical protein